MLNRRCVGEKIGKKMVEGSVDLLEILMHVVSQTTRLIDDQ